ncbi:MAG: nitroreductase family protein [Chloroflexota bacterium]
METQKAIQQRASLKSLVSDKAIEPEKVRQVVEAGRLAPSTGNCQPWRFIVVNDRNTVKKVVNESFNLSVNAAAGEAPVLLVVLANPAEGKTSNNRDYTSFDVGMAVENMLLAATDLGLVTHLMTNLNPGALKKLLGVPDDIDFVVATPLAYPTASVEAAVKERRSSRPHKELKDIVYWNRWGKAAG